MIYPIPVSRTLRLFSAIAAAMLALLSNGAAFGGNLSFLSNSAASKLNDDDVRIMNKTASDLLKEGSVGQSRDWANPKSSATGTITIVKVFQSTEGFSCKTLSMETNAGGWHDRAAYPVCEVEPGNWKIYGGARPAPAPAS